MAERVRTNKGLKRLTLSGGWFGDDDSEELAQALAHHTSLTFLRLDGCNVNARGLRDIAEALSTIKTLDTLELSKMRLGDIGAEIMANALASTSLRNLQLSDCGVGVLGSRAISNVFETNTCLEIINLSKNKIGNPGATALAQALASNSSLVEIHLRDCGIGATGSRALADALETNACLETLNLGENKIGDAGATALAHALASTTSLKTLYLDACGIGDHGMSALVEAWGTNLALPVDSDAESCEAVLCVGDLSDESLENAVRIRDAVLRKQELLLAFGMAMIQRLGGGPEEQVYAQSVRATTMEGSAFHYMNRDVFKLVGELYGPY